MAGGCLAALGRFLAWAIPIYFVVLIGMPKVRDWLGDVDRDGGSAMAIAFFIAPAAALIGGLIGVGYHSAKALHEPAKDRDKGE